MLNKKKLLVILVISALLLRFPFTMRLAANGDSPQTTLAINPSYMEVGEEGKNLTEVEPFNLNVTITDVTDLYAWQATIYYDPRILNATVAKYPPGHIFEARDFQPVNATLEVWKAILSNATLLDLSNPVGTEWKVEKRTDPRNPYGSLVGPTGSEIGNMTQWLDEDESGSLSVSDIVFIKPMKTNVEYYYVNKIYWEGSTVKIEVGCGKIGYGASLLPTASTFSGDGALFQMVFEPLRPGNRTIKISANVDSTFLLNSTLVDIDYTVKSAAVKIVGIPAVKDESTITLNIPSTVKVGSTVTISGTMSPLKIGAVVKISYKPPGRDWQTLAEVQTDEKGIYRYSWTPNQTGIYTFRAEWSGDAETKGASIEETVSVTETGEAPPEGFGLGSYLMYIIIAVIIIVIIAVAVYVLKVRKPKQQ